MILNLKGIILFLMTTSTINCSNLGGTRQDINLSNDGGYTDLLVAIDERLSENLDILYNIQVQNFSLASEKDRQVSMCSGNARACCLRHCRKQIVTNY